LEKAHKERHRMDPTTAGIVKARKPGRNIIICCDGTGNEYTAYNNTNVVRVFENVVRDGRQIAFYDPGVGTFDALGKSVGKGLGTLLGKGFGWGLQQNIEDPYRYLMDRFYPGDDETEPDKVFLFGFSRGAFTARALAGMLFKVGLLQKGSNNLIPYASKIYMGRKRIHPSDSAEKKRRKEAANAENAATADGFKATYCHPCAPYFIGVWDTVGSLGYFFGKRFFDDRLHPDVKYAYHAISIDEKRKKFPVSLWNEDDVDQEQQVVKQVWFAGVHSDVGGWYSERGLSNVALRWMLKQANAAGMRLKDGWDEVLEPGPKAPRESGMRHKDEEAQHESWQGLWKVFPRTRRVIPPNSWIHQSVIDRARDDSNTYRPWVDLPSEHRIEPW
jgi:uncharacterized protein (DUF2235 family)